MKIFTKRRFLKGVAALGSCAAGTWIYTRKIEPHWIEYVHRKLPIQHLPEGLSGKTLVHLSDLHIGHRVSDEYLMSVFRDVAEMQPDIVVYTGDFICIHRDIFPQANKMFPHLPHGRLATIGVLGNHDYGDRWSQYHVANQIAGMLGDSGVAILRNERRTIEGLEFVGIDDMWAKKIDIERALLGRFIGAPSIALCHNPDALDLRDWGEYAGWVLAGHTHGGQCKPPFLPPPLLPVVNTRYTSGEFSIDDHKQLYISRGVGHLLKARFLVRPEATIFTLVNRGYGVDHKVTSEG